MEKFGEPSIYKKIIKRKRISNKIQIFFEFLCLVMIFGFTGGYVFTQGIVDLILFLFFGKKLN